MLNYKYFSQLSKYKISVASLFRNIIVARYDASMAITKYILVPLVNAQNGTLYDLANSKTIRNNITTNDVETNFPVPSMALKLVDVNPDKKRQLNPLNTINDEKEYSPVSYQVPMELSIVTKREDDTLAIVEQILPSFKDDRSLFVNVTSEIKEKITVRLENTDLNIPDEISKFDAPLIESTITLLVDVNIYKIKQEVPPDLTIEFENLASINNIFENI